MSRLPRSSVLSTLIGSAVGPRRPSESFLARLSRAALSIAVLLLAIPIAAVLLALGLVIAAVVVVLASIRAMRMAWRRKMHGPDGRENVRVIRRP